jgi:hypothetical protein
MPRFAGADLSWGSGLAGDRGAGDGAASAGWCAGRARLAARTPGSRQGPGASRPGLTVLPLGYGGVHGLTLLPVLVVLIIAGRMARRRRR